MADARVRHITDRAIVRVIARRGAEIPAIGAGISRQIGPGEALVMQGGTSGQTLERDLAACLAPVATACDQSDAYALFALDETALSPATVRDALSRLVSVDPDAEPNAEPRAAGTLLHHMPVLLWREDCAHIIAGPASARESLFHAIIEALG